MGAAMSGAKIFTFALPGPVVSKARTRTIGKRNLGYRLTDEVRAYQARIGIEARSRGLRPEMIEGPIAVSWVACFPAPTRRSKSGAVSLKDRDNIDKIVLDGLKEFFNDNRVNTGMLHKIYGEPQAEGLYIAIAWGGESVLANGFASFDAIAERLGLYELEDVPRGTMVQ